ncbi:MAG TPA: glycoside hydrolase/phage tail family protein [Devosiaceae bacterium]|jgi:hypothetical protein|nr:glycoside hydrolase/phage tail family protein [Devosiaceae bacterium]
MATLALSLAGQVVGGAIGGPIGATVGRALGALAGAAIDGALFSEQPAPPPPGADIRLQGSSEGVPIPRLYGWSRLTGNIIWATELEELTTESSGAKGMGQPEAEESEIVASFAVGLCAGEVQRLGRVWADGQLLETEGLNLRFYRGSETQDADSLIEAKQGSGGSPAYRGLCYIVFERLPLSPFGNRIPNISVELCRAVGSLEPAIRAVTVIPGATEFGYDPVPRVRLLGHGNTANENTHHSRELSDWTLSLDELTALCPNLEHVALVVAWFGDDLRCGHCTIRPRVEGTSRDIEGASWSVAGQDRSGTPVVSFHEGGPAYGGTPSDATVRAAIADLKARGLKVTLYPIVLMDIPHDNTLPDPQTGAAGQPPYPWRGRITCDPAPGVAGSVDGTELAAAQVAAFTGTGSGWDYRRMVLHYAGIAASAGADAMLIGSELRGLTTVRGPGHSFPFVQDLVALAADVRTVVGPGVKLTYAADWSEYWGCQTGDGDRFFHLDPLWAAPAIDAVGIDNYMPLGDWRDGEGHADAVLASGPHDPDYLRANIAGGEGFDWYYASDADRIDGIRTPITDGAHGEPWVWRFKDLVGWWSNPHHERVGGVRSPVPTAWVPQGKPFWFTELGCAATDKGANQPNIFGDPKSAESGRPWFSSGAPDAVIQRQFLRAHLGYWSEAAGNPQSAVYVGPMVDPHRIYLWTWDARPYPAFPAQLASWSDGINHATGHWLTGRLGGMGSDDLLRAIAADHGVVLGEVEAVPPLLHGLTVEGIVSCRDAMAPVLAACGLGIVDRPEGLAVKRATARSTVAIAADELVARDAPLLSRRRPDRSEEVAQLALTYPDRERSYQSGTVTALRAGAGTAAAERASLVLDTAGARNAAEQMLLVRHAGGDSLDLALPPSMLALEAGDVIGVEGQGDGPFVITAIRDGETRRVAAQAVPPRVQPAILSGRPPAGSAAPAARAVPLLAAVQLPPVPAAPTESRLLLAASASPWPGRVTIDHEGSGATIATLTRNAMLGELTAPLGSGQMFTWDSGASIELRLYSGHLAPRDEAAVLAGANRLALETGLGWEIVGYAGAELLAPGRYRLDRLLRGQAGTGHAVAPAAAGSRVVILDDRVLLQPLPAEWLEQTVALRASAGRGDAVGQPFTATTALAPLLPLAPVHLRARRLAGGDIAFGWTRRSRADTDGWAADDAPHDQLPEAYRLTVFGAGPDQRQFETGTPHAVYSSAEQAADFGGPAPTFNWGVAQLSPLYGPGHFAEGSFNG